MDAGQAKQRRSLEEAEEGQIETRIEFDVSLEKRRRGRGGCARMFLPKVEQAQMREEVGDVECRLGHRGVVEVEHRESPAFEEHLVRVEGTMNRSPPPGRDF